MTEIGLPASCMARRNACTSGTIRMASAFRAPPGRWTVSNSSALAPLEAIGRLHGRTPAEVAVARVLRRPTVTGAIVGARRPGQMQGVAGAAEFRLSPWEVAEIEAFFAKVAA